MKSQTPNFIGIDPGLTGGIAVINNTGKEVIYIGDMPVLALAPNSTGRIERIVDAKSLFNIIVKYSPAVVVVEKVCSRPGEGHMGAFSFGKGYGIILAVTEVVEGVVRIDVTPTSWKKALKLNSDKLMSRELAISKFPKAVDMLGRRKDEGRAEALLLALYGFTK